jgi:hypothetical protein
VDGGGSTSTSIIVIIVCAIVALFGGYYLRKKQQTRGAIVVPDTGRMVVPFSDSNKLDSDPSDSDPALLLGPAPTSDSDGAETGQGDKPKSKDSAGWVLSSPTAAPNP